MVPVSMAIAKNSKSNSFDLVLPIVGKTMSAVYIENEELGIAFVNPIGFIIFTTIIVLLRGFGIYLLL